MSAIPRADRILRPGIDCVCQNHFTENDLIKYVEHKMPDRTVQRIERDIIQLKKGAIPTIFPNLPSYLSNFKKSRKQPVDWTKIINNTVVTINNDSIPNELLTPVNNLEIDLSNLPLPNDQWFFSNASNFIIFGCLDNDQKILKKIVISKNDYKVQVCFDLL